MREFRKKQKRFKIVTNLLVILTAVYILLYIGIQPYLSDSFALWANIGANLMVIISLAMLFLYISKYSKAEKYIESVEFILSDAGCYLTSREENTAVEYCKAVTSDLKDNGSKLSYGVNCSDFVFEARGMKHKEFFYIASFESVNSNDIIAYTDSAIYDITAGNLKRKGNGVVLFLCEKAEESAIALSKDITETGRKGQIKIACAICELSTSKVYFLGNRVTKCQQMIANYVMNCELPIKDKYKVEEKLPFQLQLEEEMKDFDINSFKEKL